MKLPRLDRLVTTGLVGPALRVVRRWDSQPESGGALPVLMYHSISDVPEPGVAGYYRLNTPPALFLNHLKILHDEGYTAVDLSTGWAELRERVAASDAAPRTPDRKLVVLTFDDGYLDFLTAAWPALEQHGFSATVFLPTAFIGQERRAFKDRACLTWQEVRDLRRLGVEFGSHTVNHPRLWELDESGLERELGESRRTIEKELGEPVTTFAHPYAFPRIDHVHVERLRRTMVGSGYRLGVTTSLGCVRPSDDPMLLKRLPANGADDVALFRAKLHGAYNWLAWPQRVIKRMKSMLPAARAK